MERGMTDIFNAIATSLNEAFTKLNQNIYEGTYTILMNQAIYTIIGLIMLFWLIKRLKGDISREETFKAIIWVTTLVFIFAILNNYGAYREFISWLYLPANYVESAFISHFASGSQNLGEMLGKNWDKLNTMLEQTSNVIDKEYEISINSLDNIFPSVYAKFAFYILWLVYSILFLALGAIILISKILALIILSLAPLAIPLLLTTQTKQYFFSWLKVFVSYSLYAPFAMIIIALALSNLEFISEFNLDSQTAKDLAQSPYYNIAVPFFMGIIAIYLLTKIPSWINQIIGTQNMEGGGTGFAGGLIKAGAMVAGGFIGGSLGARLAGKGIGASLMHGIGGSIPGGKSITSMLNNHNPSNTSQQAMNNATNGVIRAVENYYKTKG